MSGNKKPFKKSLTSRSCPIPPEKVAEDKARYGRKRSKNNVRKEAYDLVGP